MENKVSQIPEFKRYYLSEFELYDGEEFITFNTVGIDAAKNEIQIAVTDRGRISVITYDLLTDKDGRLYFEYASCSSASIWTISRRLHNGKLQKTQQTSLL